MIAKHEMGVQVDEFDLHQKDKALLTHIQRALGPALTDIKIGVDCLTLGVYASEVIYVMTFLKEDDLCQFVSLIDLCGVDYPQRSKRFDVVYHLLSLKHNRRIRVKVQIEEGGGVPSVVQVYPSAGWYEREAYDLFGIVFTGHPDLRRLLTDYGFEGHPLRKDFPLSGYVEVRYSMEDKRVIYETVSLPQDYRSFDFLSPWEGMTHQPPGDEKKSVE